MLSIHAINENTLKVKIVQPGFQDSVSRFKTAIASKDRAYDWVRQEWTVINAQKYAYIDWVFAATEDIRQPSAGEIKLTQGVLW
jgi:hypothetical protein